MSARDIVKLSVLVALLGAVIGLAVIYGPRSAPPDGLPDRIESPDRIEGFDDVE